MYRRFANRPIPVARSSSGAHRAGRRIAEPFGANGCFAFPHFISLRAGRPSTSFSQRLGAEDDDLRGVLELGPVVARPIRPVQACQEFFLVEQLGRPVPFGQAAATRMADNSRKPSQRKFARRHPEASRAAVSFRLAAPSQSKQNGMHRGQRDGSTCVKLLAEVSQLIESGTTRAIPTFFVSHEIGKHDATMRPDRNMRDPVFI